MQPANAQPVAPVAGTHNLSRTGLGILRWQVETIGDCYMVAGGLVAHDDDGYKSVISGGEDPLHAVRVMEFAKVRALAYGVDRR